MFTLLANRVDIHQEPIGAILSYLDHSWLKQSIVSLSPTEQEYTIGIIWYLCCQFSVYIFLDWRGYIHSDGPATLTKKNQSGPYAARSLHLLNIN